MSRRWDGGHRCCSRPKPNVRNVVRLARACAPHLHVRMMAQQLTSPTRVPAGIRPQDRTGSGRRRAEVSATRVTRSQASSASGGMANMLADQTKEIFPLGRRRCPDGLQVRRRPAEPHVGVHPTAAVVDMEVEERLLPEVEVRSVNSAPNTSTRPSTSRRASTSCTCVIPPTLPC